MSAAEKSAKPTIDPLDALAINTIRTLSMDAVQAANSGHPGTPMALAPVAFTLWQKLLRYDPLDPFWPDRDRFVLSVGHASMLLYSLLHLAGVRQCGKDEKPTDELAVPLDHIKKFRQLDSRTPGHPESHLTSGVETTTGPLGQGVANSVGMAMAQKWLAATFNKPGFDLFTHHVWALCGDGDLMEGISTEAASMAGHLRLGNLCWIYDSNRITIEGKTDLSYSEETGAKFLGLGWAVRRVIDANDQSALEAAYKWAMSNRDRPSLLIVDSHIAWGAPTKQDTHGAHGEPLGEEEIKGAKRFYGWPEDQKFHVPDEVRAHFRKGMGDRGAKLNAAWKDTLARYAREHPGLAEQLGRMLRRELPDGWDKDIPTFPADKKGKASRDSSGEVLNAIAKNVPWLIGGSADLAPSTKTLLKGEKDFGPEGPGRNLHFGIREHAMGAILNGLSLSRLRPYGAGFLIFYDYGRAPLRLSSIMELPTIMVFTHDSVGVGEDGPTHQPIEQLMGLRSVPGLSVFRPADANEVAEAWKCVMRLTHEPAALVLTRQALPTIDRTKYASAEGVARGAYVLADSKDPEVLLLATGSEVSLALEAHEKLVAEGIRSRVVSMPSWDHFEDYCQEHPEYREQVLPSKVEARVSIEAGAKLGWGAYVGLKGKSIGMATFGASAPFAELYKKFGFTPDAVAKAAKETLGR
ncbi:MAG: transketolase [Gemmataceae bacterium]|nr:transketolase [Gemmataceae bacterium]